MEQLVCVKFMPRTNERDYVKFRSNSDDGCSSHIGREGGEQTIKIGPRCNSQHTILHEMTHALGAWHEQSRPDRDNYLRILTENIESGREHNFLKRNVFEVDSQGESYDCASVMHYRLDSFNTRDPLHTLEVTNQTEYERQGSPDLGRVPTLSKSDVTQLNRLYNCPGSGVPGRLTVDIQMAQNLPPRDDPYVNVTAYDDSGQSVTKSTARFDNTGSPVWNTKLRFGRRTNWQYINVSIWDYDPPKNGQNEDDLLYVPQAFSVNPGVRNLEHCDNIDCNKKLTFSMTLVEECVCLNNGTCQPDKTCICAAGFGGPHCQYLQGKLTVSVFSALKLPNLDDPSRSDPYVAVTAYDHKGGITIKQTEVIRNELNPTWTTQRKRRAKQGVHFRFGKNEWSWFTIQVWDDDTDTRSSTDKRDDRLSNAYTYVLKEYTRKKARRQDVAAREGGSFNFSYKFHA